MPTTATKTPRLAGGEKSLNTAVRHALRSPAPPSLRAAVAVDLIKDRLERTYPELLEVEPHSRYLVPAHLIHPSLRVSA